MVGPTAANTEWFFGAKHDDVLDATLKAREREKRRLEASLLAGRGKAADKDAKATKGKVPVTDLVKVLKEHIQRYYDDIFDAFGEIDMNSNGRARCVCACLRAHTCACAGAHVCACVHSF